MNHIAIEITNETLNAVTLRPLVAKSMGVTTFSAVFDPSWEPYVKTIVFTAGNLYATCSRALLYTGGEMQVPWEVLETPGELWISAVGVAQGKLQPTALMRRGLTILANGEIQGQEPQAATGEVWQQVLAEVGQVRAQMQAVIASGDRAEAAAAQAAASEAAVADVLEKTQNAAQSVLEKGMLNLRVNGVPVPVTDNVASIHIPTETEITGLAAAADQEIKGRISAVTVTLPADRWVSGDGDFQAVAVEGMTEQWIPGVPVAVSQGDPEEQQAARNALGKITAITSGSGTLTFLCCAGAPDRDLTLRVPGIWE